MRKQLLYFIGLFIFLSTSTICYAGDIPETLLNNDSAYVYFGEIKSIHNESITVTQYQNIKGDFSEGRELSYEKFVFMGTPTTGERYLCGFINENNPLYIWAVSSLDTKDLEIEAKDDLSQRMQKYLNEGKFEEKEKERLSIMEAKKLENTEGKSNTELLSEQPTLIKNTNDKNLKSKTSQTGNNFRYILTLLGISICGFLIFLWRKKRG